MSRSKVRVSNLNFGHGNIGIGFSIPMAVAGQQRGRVRLQPVEEGHVGDRAVLHRLG